MRRRKKRIRVLGSVCIFATIIAAIIVFITPGPDSPEWWLARAREEARQTEDYDIHRGIIQAYCTMGKLGQARDAAHEYVNPDERSWLQETFDAILVKLKLKKQGIQFRHGAILFLRGRAYTIEERPDSSIWSIVAMAQAEAGDLAGAKTSAAAIEDARLKARTHRDMALAFSDAGDADAFRKCIELAKAATKDRYRDVATTIAETLAKAQADAGEFEAAWRTGDEMPDDDSRRRDAYRYIAAAQAKAGKIKELKRQIESIKRRRESEARRLGPGLAASIKWEDIHRELAHAYLGAAQGLLEKQAEEKNASSKKQE